MDEAWCSEKTEGLVAHCRDFNSLGRKFPEKKKGCRGTKK
jgi:hypothetical protein